MKTVNTSAQLRELERFLSQFRKDEPPSWEDSPLPRSPSVRASVTKPPGGSGYQPALGLSGTGDITQVHKAGHGRHFYNVEEKPWWITGILSKTVAFKSTVPFHTHTWLRNKTQVLQNNSYPYYVQWSEIVSPSVSLLRVLYNLLNLFLNWN